MSELNPDDPIVELPMNVICAICNVVIRKDVAHWRQSDVDNIKKFKDWTGILITRGYCPEHDPSRPETV